MRHRIEGTLDEACQHLAEASGHIARAVEQIAVEEGAVRRRGRKGHESRRAELMLRTRRSGLAAMYQRLATIQEELGAVGEPPANLGERAA